ncbi:GNAT family N-acetyltransferase [Luminiphilus sp.]|nr:GNAT family N-acetyltransferase [Luminiphilus sp.]MDB2378710.1 GNAT family N-acetyltransferase [Luminiphilus sp.]MDB2623388.1 GNAT family N-acetyltransferase [Luminiphilus sp.]MDB2692251.1 GNAT family N-acetyltransferase [Luminiphilus sp.]MDB3899115.1 GNAT family N-acetyltransferase [Luminiphilus sp.]
MFKAPIETSHFLLLPTTKDDFESLYAIAADPLVWAQHPEPDRWQRGKFGLFFDAGLLNSLGCYSILEKSSQCIIGSTRFYGLDAEAASIRIGFTFLARALWGTGANAEIKGTLLALSFNYFDTVFFDIGPENSRSIAAVTKLGAIFSHNASDDKAVYALAKSTWNQQIKCSRKIEGQL